jgi:hypothetical protein
MSELATVILIDPVILKAGAYLESAPFEELLESEALHLKELVEVLLQIL